jgi:hypothetical protein
MVGEDQVRQYLGRKVDDSKDLDRGLSSRLLRVRQPDVLKVGIGDDADVNDHVHALLDLLAWHHYEVAHGTKPGNLVQLVMGESSQTEKALPPLRTLRESHSGSPKIELCVLREDRTLAVDESAPPTFESGSAQTWSGYLADWYAKSPAGVAQAVLDAAPERDRLRLYPQLSTSPTKGRWSLRMDGLQVGEVGEAEGVLQVGSSEASSQKAVKAWLDVSDGQKAVPFSTENLAQAVTLIGELAKRLGPSDGGLLDHGVPEHAVESAVVRGTITVKVAGRELHPLRMSQSVAYGSQIPTQWAPGERPRYLDALMRQGTVPWAVEMKVKSGGGYGAYLRHAIGQAVLYRHFLRTATGIQAWLRAEQLDAQAVRAAVLYPEPTDDVRRKIAARIGNLLLTAAAFDVQVVTVDAGWVH